MGRGQTDVRWTGNVWLKADGTPLHNKDGSIPKPPGNRKSPGQTPAKDPPPVGSAAAAAQAGSPDQTGRKGVFGPHSDQARAEVLKEILASTRACQNELHRIARALEKPPVFRYPPTDRIPASLSGGRD